MVSCGFLLLFFSLLICHFISINELDTSVIAPNPARASALVFMCLAIYSILKLSK